jgi:signal transduction histidine kinase/CheY-like chemotaxis protein
LAAVLSAVASLSGVVIVILEGEFSLPSVFRIAMTLVVLQLLLFTRRKETVRTSQKAQLATLLLSDLIEGLPQGVVMQDESGAVTHYNKRASALLGLEARRVEAKPELLNIRRDAASLGMWVEHGHFRTVAGIDLQVDVRNDASGGVVTSFTDISQLQHGRESAIAMAGEKSRLLLEVGREFRAPVYALLSLIKEIASTDSDIRRRAAVSRGDILGQQLLALASNRLDELSMYKLAEDSVTLPLELEAFLRDLGSQVASYSDTPRVDLLFDIDSRLPAVLRLDGLRLRQVLISLLSNAIRFAAGGTVVLRVERLEDSEEAGKVATRWSVQDDGPGIQPSELAALFEGNARGAEGRGIGLPVSQYIARSLDTQITVASVPGYGATFSFNLMVGQDVLAGEFGDSLKHEAVQGTRVLFVAGAAQSTEHALAVLATLGYSAESACAEAVPAQLRAAAERGYPFGTVLLDTADFHEGLQPFLNGVREACAAGVITRTVAMVGHLQELQRALPASAQGIVDGLLLKPYTPRMLVEALSGVVLAGDSTASLSDGAVSLAGMQVLLAEPQPVSRQVVGRLLLRAGCQLFVVETAEELRAQVELRSGAFDVVLADADLCLQVGFTTLRISGSGREAVPLSRPPLVCMTASKGPLMLHGLSAGEVSHVLQKPVDPAKLMEVLEDLGTRAA